MITLKLIIALLILVALICYIYLNRDIILTFLSNFCNNNSNDNSHTELSDFIYAIGIGIFTSSLVALNYPSQNTHNTLTFEQYLNNLTPVLVGLILILCKNKIREGNKCCSVLSISILFLYILNFI